MDIGLLVLCLIPALGIIGLCALLDRFLERMVRHAEEERKKELKARSKKNAVKKQKTV